MQQQEDGLNLDEAREMQISCRREDDVVRIKVTFGDASIKLKATSDQGEEDLDFLVQVLPEALYRLQQESKIQEEK